MGYETRYFFTHKAATVDDDGVSTMACELSDGPLPGMSNICIGNSPAEERVDIYVCIPNKPYLGLKMRNVVLNSDESTSAILELKVRTRCVDASSSPSSDMWIKRVSARIDVPMAEKMYHHQASAVTAMQAVRARTAAILAHLGKMSSSYIVECIDSVDEWQFYHVEKTRRRMYLDGDTRVEYTHLNTCHLGNSAGEFDSGSKPNMWVKSTTIGIDGDANEDVDESRSRQVLDTLQKHTSRPVSVCGFPQYLLDVDNERQFPPLS